MHNLLYFDSKIDKHYASIGIVDPRVSYFAARACALGPVGPEPVTAMFYNFNPITVASSIPRVWEMAEPAAIVRARFEVADICLRPLLAESLDSPELREAVELARTAAENASNHLGARPLFAAHARQEWPDEPHVQLWWAQTLLREFRGDGHQATLLHSGLTGIEALIMYTATEKVDGEALRLTRGWTSASWRAAAEGLREKGLLEPSSGPGTFDVTPEGRALREWIENTTDLLALPAYSVLGTEGCERLADLGAKLNQTVVAADVIPWLKKMPAVTRRSRVRTGASRAR